MKIVKTTNTTRDAEPVISLLNFDSVIGGHDFSFDVLDNKFSHDYEILADVVIDIKTLDNVLGFYPLKEERRDFKEDFLPYFKDNEYAQRFLHTLHIEEGWISKKFKGSGYLIPYTRKDVAMEGYPAVFFVSLLQCWSYAKIFNLNGFVELTEKELDRSTIADQILKSAEFQHTLDTIEDMRSYCLKYCFPEKERKSTKVEIVK